MVSMLTEIQFDHFHNFFDFSGDESAKLVSNSVDREDDVWDQMMWVPKTPLPRFGLWYGGDGLTEWLIIGTSSVAKLQVAKFTLNNPNIARAFTL